MCKRVRNAQAFSCKESRDFAMGLSAIAQVHVLPDMRVATPACTALRRGAVPPAVGTASFRD